MFYIIKMLPKYPHAALICSQTGCGKTEFVLDLLALPLKIFQAYRHYMPYRCGKSRLPKQKMDME